MPADPGVKKGESHRVGKLRFSPYILERGLVKESRAEHHEGVEPPDLGVRVWDLAFRV